MMKLELLRKRSLQLNPVMMKKKKSQVGAMGRMIKLELLRMRSLQLNPVMEEKKITSLSSSEGNLPLGQWAIWRQLVMQNTLVACLGVAACLLTNTQAKITQIYWESL